MHANVWFTINKLFAFEFYLTDHQHVGINLTHNFTYEYYSHTDVASSKT
jgi:hypothetical protein